MKQFEITKCLICRRTSVYTARATKKNSAIILYHEYMYMHMSLTLSLTHTRTHTCTYTHTHMHVHTLSHTQTHVYTHTRTHTCTHTHTDPLPKKNTKKQKDNLSLIFGRLTHPYGNLTPLDPPVSFHYKYIYIYMYTCMYTCIWTTIPDFLWSFSKCNLSTTSCCQTSFKVLLSGPSTCSASVIS